MSQTLSPSFARCYGLARVARACCAPASIALSRRRRRTRAHCNNCRRLFFHKAMGGDVAVLRTRPFKKEGREGSSRRSRSCGQPLQTASGSMRCPP